MARDFFAYEDPSMEEPATGQAILGALSDEDWDKLIAFAARRRYNSDAPIITALDTDRAIYFVVSGAIRVVAPQPGGFDATIMTLGEGDVFGIQSFLDGAPRAASAFAVGPVEVLMLNSDMFEQLSAWQPRIAIALLRDVGANVSMRLRQHERSL